MSAPTRECLECGGRGLSLEHTSYCAPDTRHSQGACYHDPCPVCLGSGRVEARPSVRDAVADAATLLRWAADEPFPLDDFDWRAKTIAVKASADILRLPVRDVQWPEDLWRMSGQSLAFIYASAARSAFAAIPGLR